jgi:hypothetical protein
LQVGKRTYKEHEKEEKTNKQKAALQLTTKWQTLLSF